MTKLKLIYIFLLISMIFWACQEIAEISESKSEEVIENLEDATLIIDNITVITEDFPPTNYLQDGKLTGTSVEIVSAIIDKLGQEYEIELLPWSRGYKFTEDNANTCIFSTIRNVAREDLFKWVGPLAEIRVSFYARKDSGIKLNNIEDAKNYLVGVQRDGDGELFLKQNGFTKIDSVATGLQNLSKLNSGRIELIYTVVPSFEIMVRDDKTINREDFEEVFVVKTSEMYIAFNKNTSDDIVDAWQMALDDMYADNTVKEIFKKYSLEELYPEN